MDDEMKCPVCGKVGIPDYHNSDVVCPQCGSDLSIYRIIEQIPTEPKKNIWKPISAVAILATAVVSVLLFVNKPESVDVKTSKEYVQLQDSVMSLNKRIQLMSSMIQANGNNGFTYIVRKGDSYWTISKKLYGTGTRYEKIATSNNRTVNDALNIGDTLIIK